MTPTKLKDRNCRPLPKGTPALKKSAIDSFLKEIPKWKIEKGELVRSFAFGNYFETMSNVVAIAMLAQSQDHHPDMHVGYNKLSIRYSTHSVGGLSENDFISAAKIDQLIKETK